MIGYQVLCQFGLIVRDEEDLGHVRHHTFDTILDTIDDTIDSWRLMYALQSPLVCESLCVWLLVTLLFLSLLACLAVFFACGDGGHLMEGARYEVCMCGFFLYFS